MSISLPKYRCHKEVQAAKIVDIGLDGGSLMLDVNGVWTPYVIGPAWVNRHNPEVGGYLVRYADGYESFSPGAAFESGYTRIE